MIRSMLLMYDYSRIADQSNHVLDLTDQSKYLLHFALDLICLLKSGAQVFK